MPILTLKRVRTDLILLGMLYLALAYVLLPFAWKHYENQTALAGRTFVTRTGAGIPGDPLNVGLVGDRADVVRAMRQAGWFPADAITLRSSIEIIGSVVLDRPYRDAPVSNLYYDDRKEDLAFEKPSGTSADQRHHVRFWQVLATGNEGRPVWLGAVTFDRAVGISRYTGQITHHIAADLDAERDLLIADLKAAGMVEATYQVSGIGPTLAGYNGEGDRYQTDGEITFVRLSTAGPPTQQPAVIDAPEIVQAKSTVWRALLRGVSAIVGLIV